MCAQVAPEKSESDNNNKRKQGPEHKLVTTDWRMVESDPSQTPEQTGGDWSGSFPHGTPHKHVTVTGSLTCTQS